MSEIAPVPKRRLPLAVVIVSVILLAAGAAVTWALWPTEMTWQGLDDKCTEAAADRTGYPVEAFTLAEHGTEDRNGLIWVAGEFPDGIYTCGYTDDGRIRLIVSDGSGTDESYI